MNGATPVRDIATATSPGHSVPGWAPSICFSSETGKGPSQLFSRYQRNEKALVLALMRT